MEFITVRNNCLRLPKELAKKLYGMKIQIVESKEGIVLKAFNDSISEARGFLKGKRITTQRFIEMKNLEKEIEG